MDVKTKSGLYLKGNSGCSVKILNDNVVRKISSSAKYNQRLIYQINKQKNFSHGRVRSPEVYDVGMIGDLLYYDMEYIDGLTFAEFSKTSTSNDMLKLLNQIIIPNTSSMNFREQVYNKCLTLTGFPIFLIDKFNWNMPAGQCHGDLTFENILIKGGDIYLIDFGDSFMNSYLIDQSKLMQDTFCGWSYRSGNAPTKILSEINESLESKVSYFLLLIHLYRIIPYVKNKLWEMNWLKDQIRKVSLKII